MPTLNKQLEDCLRSGKKGSRHKGLIKTGPDMKRAIAHLKKAEHNRDAMVYFYQSKRFSDWSASAGFYCVYHCCLAILAKFGYESRSQNCTFLLIESLISEGKIMNITLNELKEIRDPEQSLQSSEKIVDIRESMQYGIRMSLRDQEFNGLLQRTNTLLEKFRQEINRLEMHEKQNRKANLRQKNKKYA